MADDDAVSGGSASPAAEEEEGPDEGSVTAKWQRQLWHVRHLPYANVVEREADAQLAAIQQGLRHAVLARDLRPALLHWVCELDKYMYLYSRRFTKADHIELVRLFYSLVVAPDLEFRMVKTYAHVLNNLLLKRVLLTPEDLSLDWRPLFDLYWLVTFKNLEEDGLMLIPDQLQQTLETLVCRARPYFPLQATRQILEKVRPYMCCWDETMTRAMALLQLFLPTTLTAEQHRSDGAALWLDEVWFWYESVQNSPPWEPAALQLFARLAHDCPAFADWPPERLDLVFTRLLRNLGLVLGTGVNAVEVGYGSKACPLDAAALFIASVLGGSGEQHAQTHVTALFRSLESYVHPSNFGRWTDKLLAVMQRCAVAVCQRLRRERHTKKDWLAAFAEPLTDAQVEAFVRALLPCALLAIFTKHRQDLANSAVRHLALLAPKVVLPAILEKVNEAFETLTEPHRLQQLLGCLIAVIVPLIRDAPPPPTTTAAAAPRKRRRRTRSDDEDAADAAGTGAARGHVVALMNAVLPGLDTNDMTKSILTFQVLALFCALVPLSDCSDAVHSRDDLTEEERELCSSTATLDDFVHQLMDRMLLMIETCAGGGGGGAATLRQLGGGAHASGSDASRANPHKFSLEEMLMRNGIFSVYRTVVGNCSSALYAVAADRLFNFVNENVFDNRIAAETVAEMIFCAVRTKPDESLPRFLGLILKRLEDLITKETHAEAELEDSLLWWLVLSGQLVRTSGVHLVGERDRLLRLLRLVAPLTSPHALPLVGAVLERLLSALCAVYVDNHERNRRRLDQPLDQFLPVRHWGEAYSKQTFDMVWHLPSAAEMAFVDELLEELLAPELKRLEQPSDMTKEEIVKSLSIVRACLVGVSSRATPLSGPLVPLADTEVNMGADFTYNAQPDHLPGIGFSADLGLRNSICATLRSVCAFLLAEREDDTKNLCAVVELLQLIVFSRGIEKKRFDMQMKTMAMSKKLVGDAIRGRKANVEAIEQEMCLVQHSKRLMARPGYYFTETHLAVLGDLLRLATSAYSAVRRNAQAVLEAFFSSFPYCYKLVLNDILALLKESDGVTHEQFKGALYLLIQGKKQAISVRHSWQTLGAVWPALILAQHSEKPSIIALLEQAQNAVVDNLESFQIAFTMPKTCRELAAGWLNDDAISSREAEFDAAEKTRNEAASGSYYGLIARLVELSSDSSLHWRHADMAQSLLSLLIRRDTRFPASALRLFARLLAHDSVKTRQMAVSFVGAHLKISRPLAVKRPLVAPAAAAPLLTAVGAVWPLPWGVRADNEWLLADVCPMPTDAAQLDEMVFVDKSHWGLGVWPAQLDVYAPASEQAAANRPRDQLTPEELALVDAFADADFLDKFAALMSVEEKKGEDRFNPLVYCLFKGLFRNFNDILLESFKPVVERLVNSQKEGEQRLAAEIMAGLLQGSRLWRWEKLAAMWPWARQTLQTAVENVNTETAPNWGSALATVADSRDPRRLGPLFALLFDLAAAPLESSFHASTWVHFRLNASYISAPLCSRLFLLQSAVNQLGWRVLPMWHRLNRLLEPMLPQPYQNLRERIGSCLTTIAWFDVPAAAADATAVERAPPRIADMVDAAFKGLQPLLAEVAAGSPQQSTTANGGGGGDTENGERKEAILLLKTCLSWLNAHWQHSFFSAPDALLRFLPLLCYYENETSDDELKRSATHQLRGLARALLTARSADLVLAQCREMAASGEASWWKAKVSLLRYLQTTVFSNAFLFGADERRAAVGCLVERLLLDAQLEVREAASDTYCGLLLCGYLRADKQALARAQSWTRSADAARKHGGVLALAAIVRAYPYTVPNFVPTVLMHLCPHASAPPPLRQTVRKALGEFKRTHLDCWHEHKQLFTDDQLSVLTDLLVSPNYYV